MTAFGCCKFLGTLFDFVETGDAGKTEIQKNLPFLAALDLHLQTHCDLRLYYQKLSDSFSQQVNHIYFRDNRGMCDIKF